MDDGLHDLATSTSKRNRPVVGWIIVSAFFMERNNNWFLPIRRKYREVEDNVVDNRERCSKLMSTITEDNWRKWIRVSGLWFFEFLEFSQDWAVCEKDRIDRSSGRWKTVGEIRCYAVVSSKQRTEIFIKQSGFIYGVSDRSMVSRMKQRGKEDERFNLWRMNL